MHDCGSKFETQLRREGAFAFFLVLFIVGPILIDKDHALVSTWRTRPQLLVLKSPGLSVLSSCFYWMPNAKMLTSNFGIIKYNCFMGAIRTEVGGKLGIIVKHDLIIIFIIAP